MANLQEAFTEAVKLNRQITQVKRVLRPDGTLWVNIGDSYRGKNLLGVPWMLAFALRADGWYLRQDIIWNKTRCIPESVRDRCTKSHEYIFLLSKSGRYYFNGPAIREPVAESTIARMKQDIAHQKGSFRQPGKTNGPLKPGGDGKTRNKRSVWSLCPAYFKGAHCAVFPEKLVEPCILAGCPESGMVLDPFAGSGTTPKKQFITTVAFVNRISRNWGRWIFWIFTKSTASPTVWPLACALNSANCAVRSAAV